MLAANDKHQEAPVPPATLQAMRAMPDKELFDAEARLISRITQLEGEVDAVGYRTGKLIQERRDLDIQIAAGSIDQQEGAILVEQNKQALHAERDSGIDINNELATLRVALRDFSAEVMRRKQVQKEKNNALLAQYASGRIGSLQKQFAEIAAELCVLARWKHGAPWEVFSPERVMTIALIESSGDKSGLNLIRKLDGELSAKVLKHDK